MRSGEPVDSRFWDVRIWTGAGLSAAFIPSVRVPVTMITSPDSPAAASALSASAGAGIRPSATASAANDAVSLNFIGSAPFLFHGSRSEEHTSELQSLMRISYAVFCLKKKKKILYRYTH